MKNSAKPDMRARFTVDNRMRFKMEQAKRVRANKKPAKTAKGHGLMCCIPLDNPLRANLTTEMQISRNLTIVVSDGGHGVWVVVLL